MQKKSSQLKSGTFVRKTLPKDVYLIMDVERVVREGRDCLSFTMMGTNGRIIEHYVIPIDWIDQLNFFEILS